MRIPVVMTAYGLDDDGQHGPNEHMSIEMFHRGIETAIVYLAELSELRQGMNIVATPNVEATEAWEGDQP